MPIKSCEVNGKPGYQWGDSGKCYTFNPGDVDGMMTARSRASAQGTAAYSSGYTEGVKLPAYVIAALKKGVELHKDGFSGDGLKPATVRSASDAIKSGEWSDDKIIRAAAWLARHDDDRDLTGGRDWSDPPTPGYTAWLLWGDSGDGRGRAWIQSMADKIKSKEEAAGDSGQGTPAPPEDRIKGGKNTGKGTARSPAPSFNKQTTIALKRLVKAHNDAMGGDERKISTLPMLKKVWLRGAGAFSTSHRPGVTRAQWAFGRVRAFLKMLKNLKPDDPKYNGPDNDLLPKAHPLKSNKNEEHMKPQEGMYYKYEGYGRLYEGNWGMRFVALRHTLGDMLHFYMAKEISDDDVAAKYIEDMGNMIETAKKLPAHGEAAKTSFYTLMSQVSQTLQNWQERDPQTAGGQMFYSLRMVQDRFEEKYGQDAPPSHREAVEDPTESQRKDLPAAAFEPSAFFSEDGEFRRSLSKLPHHINTAEDPNDNETVDVPRLRNALARFDQTDFSGFPEGTKERVKAHLEMHAEALLYGNKEESVAPPASPTLSRAYPCASSILSYVENATKDVHLRAKLERQADSILLVAENQGRDAETPIVALRSALERLRG